MKYLRILIILIAIGLASFICWKMYLYLGKGTVSVTVEPEDASVVIDEQSYKPSDLQNIELEPGEHTIVVTLDGFKTVTQTITMDWQDQQNLSYTLNPKSFREIYQPLSPDPGYTNYSIADDKFFLGNTWAAGYIVDEGEAGTVSYAVIRRVNGAWRLVTHNHEVTDETKNLMPAVVYDHIKGFEE